MISKTTTSCAQSALNADGACCSSAPSARFGLFPCPPRYAAPLGLPPDRRARNHCSTTRYDRPREWRPTAVGRSLRFDRQPQYATTCRVCRHNAIQIHAVRVFFSATTTVRPFRAWWRPARSGRAAPTWCSRVGAWRPFFEPADHGGARDAKSRLQAAQRAAFFIFAARRRDNGSSVCHLERDHIS